jgi:SPP1 gp7 family putative phage head morphogenesis protein
MPTPPPGIAAIDLSYTVARLANHFLGTQLQTRAFGPGVPLAPTVPTIDQIQPRQYQYGVSWNTQLTPRRESPQLTPFEQLRALASAYDVAALCIATRIEELQGLPLHIRARNKKEQPAEQATCDSLEAWFQKPDRVTPYPSWIGALLYDLFSLDALTLYPHPDRGGGLWGLEYIDGSTIKPLLDARGQTAAYQQVLYGTPWSNYERSSPDTNDDDFAEFSSSELLYAPRWTRSFTPYGFPPTEWIILRVNTALRKQTFDLGHFTDSNIPAGILSPPEGLMQPEQVAAFEEWWNAKLQGDDLARQRILFLPWAGKLIPLNTLSDGGRYESSLDEWMLKITCAAFGVPPSEIGFTADVNKATSEGQENIVYRRGLGPLTAWLLRVIFNPIIQSSQYLGQPQLEAWFDFGESGDQAVEARTQQNDVAAGVITATESRRLRYPDLDGDAPGVPAAAPGGAPTATPFQRIAKRTPEPSDALERLKQERAARRIIALAYAAQQARIAAQLEADLQALDWSREPGHLAEAVLPLFEQTTQQAAKQALTQLNVATDWGMVNEPVLALARARAAAFGDEVSATAEARTAARVADWVERGGTMDDLIQSVSEVWSGPRADVAAITSVTQLYHDGNVEAWKASNVVKGWQFHSVHDAAVCDICDPLDGQVFALDDDDHAPPQHPGCRCFSTASLKASDE